MEPNQIEDLRSGYDAVAEEYTRRIADELKGKPLDRELLDRFASNVEKDALVYELGCGPGHVGRYLADRGVNICGVDLSEGMVEQARLLNPGVAYKQGDMRHLDAEDGSLGGIVAFYSIIHIPRAEVVPVLQEMKRVLRSGGLLFLSFHIGDEVLHLEEWWGRQVSMDFIFFSMEEMKRYLLWAGFQIEDAIEREPYPEVEHQSRRGYIFSVKPGKSKKTAS